MPSPLALKVNQLTMQFGGLKAVSGLDLEILEGQIFGLIGPNGAGKTTVFNMLTGVYKPTQGAIQIFGREITSDSKTALKPFEITAFGVARTFQNIRLFKNLSVLDNILIAMDHNPAIPRFGLLPSILRTRALQNTENSEIHKALELLSIFSLSERSGVLARNLPYGDQRRLEIARAMATGARLLLLDEPAAGMNAQETASLMQTIKTLQRDFKLTVFLIEHDMKLVMGICERIAVLDYGVKIAEGTASEIQRNTQVIEAYLGKPAAQDGKHHV